MRAILNLSLDHALQNYIYVHMVSPEDVAKKRRAQYPSIAYKEAIGKEFKRLTFYLIPRDEFSDNESDSESFAGICSTELLLCTYGFSGGCRKEKKSTISIVDVKDDELTSDCSSAATESLTLGQSTGGWYSVSCSELL